METKTEKNNIATAILAVMQEVKGVEKDMNVGSGNMSYKGVSDQSVKKIIGDAMQRNGLSLLPLSIEPKTTVSRWEETNQYGTKQKQSVFTEVVTKYLLLHESGESIELSGYGHGVDSQDKGAGKATTYALKYTLLYSFLVPTGKIDDADNEHSEDIAAPAKAKEVLTPKHKHWNGVAESLAAGKVDFDGVKVHFELSKENQKELEKLAETIFGEQNKIKSNQNGQAK